MKGKIKANYGVRASKLSMEEENGRILQAVHKKVLIIVDKGSKRGYNE